MQRCPVSRLPLALAGLLLAGSLPAADYPAWWTQRHVVVATRVTNDYFVANLGQLKWFATNACDELEARLPGGAGSKVWALVRGFRRGGNRVVVNQGQLKAVAQPFYDRLIAAGYASAYPWTPALADDAHYAPANLGQLKQVFSFDPTHAPLPGDLDGDGLPDAWETAHGLNPRRAADAEADGDADGWTSRQEYLRGGSPTQPATSVPGATLLFSVQTPLIDRLPE